MSAETIESAAADADAAPLDLLLTDAALGVLNRVNRATPGCGWRSPSGGAAQLRVPDAGRDQMVRGVRTHSGQGSGLPPVTAASAPPGGLQQRIETEVRRVQDGRRSKRYAMP
jgi:hypothetical protein